jgi:hypothetical protein
MSELHTKKQRTQNLELVLAVNKINTISFVGITLPPIQHFEALLIYNIPRTGLLKRLYEKLYAQKAHELHDTLIAFQSYATMRKSLTFPNGYPPATPYEIRQVEEIIGSIPAEFQIVLLTIASTYDFGKYTLTNVHNIEKSSLVKLHKAANSLGLDTLVYFPFAKISSMEYVCLTKRGTVEYRYTNEFEDDIFYEFKSFSHWIYEGWLRR